MENKEISEKVSSQINRMKAMMNYGLKNENKQYSAVEYSRKGADGNTYGIIREGSKYHIKVANAKNPSKSDYNYIGGFANHKSHMFESFANAQKHFDMKMRSLNEAYGKTGANIDSWNLDGRNAVLNEMTDKMRLEIYRQREIMNNANIISEGKDKAICKDKASCIEKNNIKMSKPTTGDAKGNGGDFFTEKPETEFSDMEKNNIKGKQAPVVENIETELGDVNIASGNEGAGAGQTNVMGGSLGEDEDFDETDVEITDDSDNVDVDAESTEDDFDDMGDEDFSEDSEELEEFPEEGVEDEFEDDSLTAQNASDEVGELRGEMSQMRALIDAIAEKLGVSEFDKDEPLYDDEESDEEDFETEDFEDEDSEGKEYDVEFDSETDDEDEDETVFESASYRRIMAEAAMKDKLKKMAQKAVNYGKRKVADWKDDINAAMQAPNRMKLDKDEEDDAQEGKWQKARANASARKKARKEADELDETVLHDWGKHPRYQKEPMTYPTPKMAKKPGQYDEGEGEETTNKPYGKEIGDGKFFDQSKGIEKITNSIAETIRRTLRKNV